MEFKNLTNKLLENSHSISGGNKCSSSKGFQSSFAPTLDPFKIEINYPNQFPFKTPPFFSNIKLNDDQNIDGLGQVSFSITCPGGLSPADAASRIIDSLIGSLNTAQSSDSDSGSDSDTDSNSDYHDATSEETDEQFYDCIDDENLFVVNEQSYLRKCFRNLEDYDVEYVFEKVE